MRSRQQHMAPKVAIAITATATIVAALLGIWLGSEQWASTAILFGAAFFGFCLWAGITA